MEDQATLNPASSSVQKLHLLQTQEENNEKALNILLSAIPDRHLLSFHDATNKKTLWTTIKARFGGNEASKKMQKNLLKQQFSVFTIGSREELDSAYERFQHILSMLELYDATVSLEDANLKIQSKALVATDKNEDIDWTKEFDAEPSTCTLDKMELDDFDWSNKADDALVSLALMATNSELLQNEVLNKQRYLSDKSCIGFGVESSSSKDSDNSSRSTNSTESLYTNIQKTKGFHSVPPPTGTIIPPRANVSFTGIDELAIRNKNTVFSTENSKISFENKSPNSQHSIGQESRTKGLGNKGGSFSKGSLLSHHALVLTREGEKFARPEVPQRSTLKVTGNLSSKGNPEDISRTMLSSTVDALEPGSKEYYPLWKLVRLPKATQRMNSSYGTVELGHATSKISNKLVKGNLVRVYLQRHSNHDYSLLACRKGNSTGQSCKKMMKETVENLFELLHMDFVWTCFSVESVMEEVLLGGRLMDCVNSVGVFLGLQDETYDMLHD
ncbi:hypothetical protein Tco_1042776 [Tanacetum coccineum]|uniref:Uncharacterized protein n=1 Tax=Tanacetum coccineum TaxID=301880 RepID=A0ABQ5GK25_9ASTR